VSVVFLKAAIFQKQQKKLFSPEMAVFVNAVEVRWNWNMITSFHFPVVDKALLPTFSCYVRNVTEVNQTVVFVKFITEKWESIVAMMMPLKANHIPPQ
jgi:hypothetical protein